LAIKYEYEITSGIDLRADNIFLLFEKLYILNMAAEFLLT
jgi:hypothetical protein